MLAVFGGSIGSDKVIVPGPGLKYSSGMSGIHSFTFLRAAHKFGKMFHHHHQKPPPSSNHLHLRWLPTPTPIQVYVLSREVSDDLRPKSIEQSGQETSWHASWALVIDQDGLLTKSMGVPPPRLNIQQLEDRHS